MRDVEIGLLRAFEHVVVRLALALDLRRQAVEALRAAFGARQRQVADGPRDTAVAIVEGVEWSQTRDAPTRPIKPARYRLVAIEPVRETPSSGNQGCGRRGFVMNALPPMGPDTTCIGPYASSRHAPATDLAQARSRWGTAPHASRTGVPRSTGSRNVCGGVEHHLDHAFDVPIDRASAPIRCRGGARSRSALIAGRGSRPRSRWS